MGLLKEQCAEKRKAPLLYCCNQVWMKIGGQIPRNAIPICEMLQISSDVREWLQEFRENLCGNTNTNVRRLHVSRMTSQHATRDPTTQQQGWRFGLVSPWRQDHTRGSRQDIHSARVPGSPGRLWMARYHHND